MTNIANRFKLGQLVCFIADRDHIGVVTGIMLRPGGGLQYYVTWADSREETLHFELELDEDETTE